jgi:hypothetical protein
MQVPVWCVTKGARHEHRQSSFTVDQPNAVQLCKTCAECDGFISFAMAVMIILILLISVGVKDAS